MAVKPQKPRRPRPVAFCRVRVGQQCRYDGQLVHKFASKKAMTPQGKVVQIKDATLVQPA